MLQAGSCSRVVEELRSIIDFSERRYAELFLQLAWAAVAGSLAEMDLLIEQHCAEGQAYGRPRPLFRTGERRGRGTR